MVDRIEFKELETEELPVTSSVLLGAAHHLGNNILNSRVYEKTQRNFLFDYCLFF